jgi:hypothetical protein
MLLIDWIIESWKNIDHVMIKKSFHSCGYGVDNQKVKWMKFYSIE